MTDKEKAFGKNIRLEPVYTEPYTTGILLRVTVPGFPKGDVFLINIPEILCANATLIMNYLDITSKWTCAEGAMQLDYTKPGAWQLKVVLHPKEDVIDIAVTVKNIGDSIWNNTYTFNCFNPVNAPSFFDPTMARTFVNFVQRGLLSLDNTHREICMEKFADKRQGYEIQGGGLPKTAGYYFDMFGVSNDIAAEPFIAIVSRDGKMTIGAGTAREDGAFLWNNTAISCIHLAYGFGDVAPGERKEVRGKLYFIRGGLGELYQRYQLEFRGHQP